MHKPVFLNSNMQFTNNADEPDIPRTFKGIAYSGEQVKEYFDNMVVDLSTTSVEIGMPLLLQHDHTKIVGVVTDTKKGNDFAIAGELFSDIEDEAYKIAKKSKRGAKYQLSIGIYSYEREDIKQGNKVVVNGKEFTGPITVLKNGTIREVSICALGADKNTSVTILNQKERIEMADFPNTAETKDPTPPEAPKQEEKPDMMMERVKKIEERIQAIEDAIGSKEKEEPKMEARARAVKELAFICGKELTPEVMQAFSSMSDSQFNAISNVIKTVQLPEILFKAQAQSGCEPAATDKKKKQSLDPKEIYANRAKTEKGEK